MRVRLGQQMYFPRYYSRSEPFIRLELNRAYYSDASHHSEPIEISLMIHRSGICIMTFATPIAREFDTETGYGYLQAGARMLDEVELSVPFVSRNKAIPKSIVEQFRSVETHDGLQWIVLNAERLESKLSLLSVFHTYLGAIENLARRDVSTEWRCYTTLFQGTPRCGCDGAEAKERHAVEFAQLMVRCPSPLPVTDDVRKDLLKNYLMNSDQELWLGPGSGIHTFWQRDDINYLTDIQTVVPIESAILQYRQLEAIDHRTVNVSIRDGDLSAAQKQLATGLPEYGRNLMPDMNAPEVVDGLASKLRTAQLYSRLNDRVKVLESVVNTRYSRRQSRRSSRHFIYRSSHSCITATTSHKRIYRQARTAYSDAITRKVGKRLFRQLRSSSRCDLCRSDCADRTCVCRHSGEISPVLVALAQAQFRISR
jgi:hypothetical protein